MGNFMAVFDQVVGSILGVVWHDAVCWYNLAAGLLFTVLLLGAQYRYLPKAIKMIFASRKEESSTR